MQPLRYPTESGSAIICALCTILIVSIVGAAVLFNCSTRYNVTAKQVEGWKNALYAAEGGGDIALAAVRGVASYMQSGDPPSVAESKVFSASKGWTSPAASAAPTPGPSFSHAAYTSGPNNSLSAIVTIDRLPASACPPGDTNPYYRIRSAGVAKLSGLSRTGMDDKLLGMANTGTHFAAGSSTRGSGDSLLRKIDLAYDHFRATYGDGDGNNLQAVAVLNPQVTRRIELIAVPVTADFFGGMKTSTLFFGPGNASQIDSFDSKLGGYPGASIAQNPVAPSDPNYQYYAVSRETTVSVGTGNFSAGGPIYGNVTTNGGHVTSPPYNISGSIDNNVPFTVPPLPGPDTSSFSTLSSTTVNLPQSSENSQTPATYVYARSLTGTLTINGQTVSSSQSSTLAGQPIETYVTIVIQGDITGGIQVDKGVNAKIYFTGDIATKARNIVNNNVDGAAGVYSLNGGSVSTSQIYSRAGHLELYGISPTNGSSQTVNIDAGSGSGISIYATLYAPSADVTVTGSPDWYGAVVAKSFQGNGNGGGNTSFHFDIELTSLGAPTDYQIASYVEDIR